jgi:hypothetical protein
MLRGAQPDLQHWIAGSRDDVRFRVVELPTLIACRRDLLSRRDLRSRRDLLSRRNSLHGHGLTPTIVNSVTHSTFFGEPRASSQ